MTSYDWTYAKTKRDAFTCTLLSAREEVQDFPRLCQENLHAYHIKMSLQYNLHYGEPMKQEKIQRTFCDTLDLWTERILEIWDRISECREDMLMTIQSVNEKKKGDQEERSSFERSLSSEFDDENDNLFDLPDDQLSVGMETPPLVINSSMDTHLSPMETSTKERSPLANRLSSLVIKSPPLATRSSPIPTTSLETLPEIPNQAASLVALKQDPNHVTPNKKNKFLKQKVCTQFEAFEQLCTSHSGERVMSLNSRVDDHPLIIGNEENEFDIREMTLKCTKSKAKQRKSNKGNMPNQQGRGQKCKARNKHGYKRATAKN